MNGPRARQNQWTTCVPSPWAFTRSLLCWIRVVIAQASFMRPAKTWIKLGNAQFDPSHCRQHRTFFGFVMPVLQSSVNRSLCSAANTEPSAPTILVQYSFIVKLQILTYIWIWANRSMCKSLSHMTKKANMPIYRLAPVSNVIFCSKTDILSKIAIYKLYLSSLWLGH